MQIKTIKNNLPSAKDIIATSRPLSWFNSAIPFFIGYTIANGSINLRCILGTIYFCLFYNYLDHIIDSICEDKYNVKPHAKNPDQPGTKRIAYFAIGLNIPFIIFFLYTGSLISSLLLVLIIFLSYSYPAKPLRLKVVPIGGSIVSGARLILPLIFGLVYAGASSLPWPAITAFFCWGLASQALGSIPSIKVDRAASVQSIATKLGARLTNSYCIILYSLCCLITAVFYYPYGALASVLLLAYPLNTLFFRKFKSDARSLEYRRAWKNFIWLNLIIGVWLGLLLLSAFDPFSLGANKVLWFAGAILGFAIIQLGLMIYNYKKLTRPKSKRLGDLPHIDILIHSSGDKDNIASTILALIGQNYPHFDIYYANLDNNLQSQKIVEGYQDKRLHIIEIPKPPSGWLIQPWASNVLFKKSKSDLVVLLGADTILLPNTLAVIASAIGAGDVDLISLLPADQNKSFWQQLIMSQEQYLFFGFYPLPYLNAKHPRLAYSRSNLLGFKRAPISKLGGFEIVKNNPLEEFDIANTARQAGLNTAFYCASDLAINQNKASLANLRSYHKQCLYPAMRFNMPLTIALVTGGIFMVCFPILLLTYLLVTGRYGGTILLALSCFALLLNRLIVMYKSKQNITSALLFPIGTLLILLELIVSMVKYEFQKPRWQSRYEA